MKRNDHIRIANLPSGHYRIFCLHCGQHYTPALPCPVDIFLATVRQFAATHAGCQPQDGAPTQDEILARFDRGSL